MHSIISTVLVIKHLHSTCINIQYVFYNIYLPILVTYLYLFDEKFLCVSYIRLPAFTTNKHFRIPIFFSGKDQFEPWCPTPIRSKVTCPLSSQRNSIYSSQILQHIVQPSYPSFCCYISLCLHMISLTHSL